MTHAEHILKGANPFVSPRLQMYEKINVYFTLIFFLPMM